MASEAYKEGKDIGLYMRGERDDGRFDYDCRWDLADAAKKGTDFFNEFKRGLEEGLKGDG